MISIVRSRLGRNRESRWLVRFSGAVAFDELVGQGGDSLAVFGISGHGRNGSRMNAPLPAAEPRLEQASRRSRDG